MPQSRASSGTCEAKNSRLIQYKEKTEELLKGFVAYEIEHIPRTENTEADILSKIALEGIPDHLLRICQKEELHRPSIEEPGKEIQQVMVPNWYRTDNPEMFWIEDILQYKENGKLPDDPAVAARVRRKAPSFEIIDGRLYKRSFGGPLLKCLRKPEAERLMDEAHRGICAAHQGAHTLARKLVVQGFYWPTMMRDCIGWIAKCPLPLALGRFKFCVVAIDYFTKWVETEPLATITEYQCRYFLWKKALHGVFSAHSILHTKVSVTYPQANGQVENMNRTIADGIRKKLEDVGGNWADKLDRVLWAYRNTQRRATGESLFSLAYGFEAKVTVEVVEPTYRISHYTDEGNEESLRIEKNFLEERRETAHARIVEYQQAVKRYRDKRIRPRAFQVGDLVLRDRQASRPTEGGKFTVKWEGPYRIADVVQAGTYKLETLDGELVDRTWNVLHLKKYYQ
ncbi:PREDICTED: uncharacterized protein LOC109179766 [Ipomoea nil]|uniref:uncharacterized protein LOC109179766 n=1 Tax=Ipomoea nil TaxID=35883 RepID=UPI000900BBAE|nr:PREDICTED: uncharacterized protein LOC109179766 [Ipomoea nil]